MGKTIECNIPDMHTMGTMRDSSVDFETSERLPD